MMCRLLPLTFFLIAELQLIINKRPARVESRILKSFVDTFTKRVPAFSLAGR
jgi:hypothetical protein